MASEVSMCSMALVRCGEDEISSLSDTDKHSKLCNLVYASTRDKLLAAHNWNFATKRANLSLTSTTPEFDFAYQFSIPSDSLRILPMSGNYRDADWRREGAFIVADTSSISIKYLAKITDTSLFPVYFQENLEAELAKVMCFNLVNDPKLKQLIFQEAKDAARMARSTDGQEGEPLSIHSDAWLESRL